jgi:hypothetical protein
MTARITILDVLENALDGQLSGERVQRMTLSDVRDLRDAVIAHYVGWAPRPADEGILRAHFGGWVASMPGRGAAHDVLATGLLYAHEVVVHDPVAAYFEPRRRMLTAFREVMGNGISGQSSSSHFERTSGYESFVDDLDAHHSHLSAAVERVGSVAPLLRSGAVVPIPHLKLVLQREARIWDGVTELLGDRVYRSLIDTPIDRPAIMVDDGPAVSLNVEPKTSEDWLIQRYGDAAYYFARSLAMASVSYSTYLAPSGTEWAIYDHRLRQLHEALSRRRELELTLAPALAQSELPYFRGLSAADLVSARRDGEGFEEWRTGLRTAARQIATTPGEGERFIDDARDVLNDHIVPLADAVRRETSRSATLRRHARSSTVSLVTGVAAGYGAMLAGAPAPPIETLGLGSLLGWAMNSLLPTREPGARAVVAHLQHGMNRPALRDGWPKREAVILRPHKPAP